MYVCRENSLFGVRFDRKEQEIEWPEIGVGMGCLPPHWVGSGEGAVRCLSPLKFFLNFKSKMPSFMHFYCEKVLVAAETGTGRGLNLNPWGLKRRKNTGVENLAVGFQLRQPPPSTRILIHTE